jgi:predicted RNase H-like nuclease (RuvC/YqgF family)
VNQAITVTLPEPEDINNEMEKIKILQAENEVRTREKINPQMRQTIDKLKAKCEEKKKNMEIEELVKNDVCTAMQKQITELENTYMYSC